MKKGIAKTQRTVSKTQRIVAERDKGVAQMEKGIADMEKRQAEMKRLMAKIKRFVQEYKKLTPKMLQDVPAMEKRNQQMRSCLRNVIRTKATMNFAWVDISKGLFEIDDAVHHLTPTLSPISRRRGRKN